MSRPFENREHLVRVAGLFAAGIVAFLVIQAVFVPPGFGLYGHYRPGALADNQRRVPVYAGRAACAECHSDEAGALRGGKHATVGCEACHGALGRHAEDASLQKAERPDGRGVCLVCHTENVAKPRSFPRVDPAEHAPEGSCLACHTNPHSPAIQ